MVVQVPDKRFYWLKVFALATAKQWEALEKFSKEKKPPIGRMPIKYLVLVVRSWLKFLDARFLIQLDNL